MPFTLRPPADSLLPDPIGKLALRTLPISNGLVLPPGRICPDAICPASVLASPFGASSSEYVR